MRIRKIGIFGWAFAVLMGLAAADPAAASCTNASLTGIYGVLSSGTNTSGTLAAGVYQFDSDGSGGLTGTGTQSTNGTIQSLTLNGTYSISSNCTGTITLQDQSNDVVHFNIMLDNTNAGFELIRTDSGYTASGEAYALDTTVCGFSGKPAIYAKHLDGHVVGTSKIPVSIVGRLTSDGSGNVSAIDTFSENGVISTRKPTGSYTTNQNCTGTAQISYKGTTYNFASVIVSAGKKLLLLETDAGTVISGKAIAE
jgi:hypothetical protein